MSGLDDMVGRWVEMPDGVRGQVWAVAGCRRARDETCGHKGCPRAVWVADGVRWRLVRVADIKHGRALAETA